MIVLVDLDNVVADMISALNERLERAGVVPIAAEAITDYEFYNLYSVKDYLHVQSILRTPGFFRELPLMPGAKQGVEDILRYMGEVYFVTSPMKEAPHSAGDKLVWVKKHFGRGMAEMTIITQDKTAVKGDILIDDKPEILGRFSPEWKRWVYDQPYNQHTAGVRVTWDTLWSVISFNLRR